MDKLKSSLKSKEGMALPGVLMIFLALTLFASAMYVMAMTSFREVRYMSEGKKAEYLAQAGVEAAAYAFQTAVNKRDNNSDYDTFITNTTNNTDSVITSKSPVYMVWYGSGNPSNPDEKYGFISGSTPEETEAKVQEFVNTYGEENVIGSFEVELKNGEKTYDQFKMITYDADNPSAATENDKIELKASTKIIRATGHSYNGDNAYVKSAYIPNPKQASGVYYGDDGIIKNDSTDQNNSQLTKVGVFKTQSKLTIKTNIFGSASIDLQKREIPVNLAYCAGNMILGKPKSADEIKFSSDKDNIMIFAGMNDLFVQTAVNVEPGQKHFNYLFLRGNNIVVNGDIELYAYGFTRNTNLNLTANIGTMADLIAGKYRFGTVILGTPSKAGGTVVDPVNNNSVYNFGQCGRIYFGGNVYVNIEFPSVGVYRYKAFSAGDAYYFDDDAKRTTDANLESPFGIDLFKYFLDKAIAEQSYSPNVIRRFEDLINTYYNVNGEENATQYVQVDENGKIIKDAMRKIDRDKFSKDKFSDLIPPDPIGSVSIVYESEG